jgi:hypothetical protein
MVLAITMAGCGSGSGRSSEPAGLQSPSAAGPYNSYVGTSPLGCPSSVIACDPGNPSGYGIWSASFDHTTSLFNAWDVTSGGNNTDPNSAELSGTFSLSGGFLALTQTNDPGNNPLSPAGFAFEIPGRVAILRQGGTRVPVTAMVPSGCPSINGNVQFNFVLLPTSNWVPADPAFGSLLISTSGLTWNLASYELSTSSALSGAPASQSGAALPPGTCGTTAAGDTVYVPSDLMLPLPKTIAVGPSGFYIADQGQASNGAGNPGEIGVIQPSAQLTTSDVLSKNYLGFMYEPGANDVAVPESQMVAFSASTPAEQLVGGAFPGDDPALQAATNLTINLGVQDANIHGLYRNVVITNQNNGTVQPTTYSAVAVVGNPESKYAIFIIAEDTDNSLPLGIYLFQK